MTSLVWQVTSYNDRMESKVQERGQDFFSSGRAPREGSQPFLLTRTWERGGVRAQLRLLVASMVKTK